MLKARGMIDGKDTVIIGLSHGNLDKFRAGPLDSFIHIERGTMELPFDIIIFSARTEAELEAFVHEHGGKRRFRS